MDKDKSYFSETSYASINTLNSFVNKKKRIKKYIDFIEEDIKKLILLNEEDEKSDIIRHSIHENFINYCECIYSCMEYLGYTLYISKKK